MSIKKVLLCSWGQLEGKYSNLGDRLIFDTQIKLIRKIRPLTEIFVISGNPDYTQNNYNVQAANPFSLFGFFRYLSFFRRADLVIIGGGEIVQDKSSKLYLIFNLLPVFLSKLFGKKCLALGVGISNKEELSGFGAWLTKLSFRYIDVATIRDENSHKSALELGLRPEKCVLSSDIVFSNDNYTVSDKNHAISKTNSLKYAVFSLRDIVGRKGGFLPKSFRKRFRSVEIKDNKILTDFLDKVIEVIQYLINKHHLNIILWSTYNGKNFSSRDDQIHQYIYDKLAQRDSVKLVNEPILLEEAMSILSNAKFLVGVPLHSQILATISNCPFLPVIYAQKGRNFVKEIKSLFDKIVDLSSDKNIIGVNVQQILDNIENIFDNTDDIKREMDIYLNHCSQRNDANIEILSSYLGKL